MTSTGRRGSAGARDVGADPIRRLVLSGVLFGAGIAASVVDLLLFHLVLQWHHFYDLGTTEMAIAADGFFHAAAWGMTVAGLFLLVDVRRRASARGEPARWGRWTGAVLVGLGGFQLLDAVVNHKLLGIHQVRYDVDLLPYDIAWIGSAIVVLAIGLVVLRRSRAPTEP
ncbi:DUF2243 domain-containing protein [Agrococcus sp. TSP3-2-1]|uniref:DUF2243 domain-containing protein n=1 Tax=Agrococcus sp. TSP3-2-1 TaxID=2804583 RepID=UPI003CEAA159